MLELAVCWFCKENNRQLINACSQLERFDAIAESIATAIGFPIDKIKYQTPEQTDLKVSSCSVCFWMFDGFSLQRALRMEEIFACPVKRLVSWSTGIRASPAFANWSKMKFGCLKTANENRLFCKNY